MWWRRLIQQLCLNLWFSQQILNYYLFWLFTPVSMWVKIGEYKKIVPNNRRELEKLIYLRILNMYSQNTSVLHFLCTISFSSRYSYRRYIRIMFILFVHETCALSLLFYANEMDIFRQNSHCWLADHKWKVLKKKLLTTSNFPTLLVYSFCIDSFLLL